MIVKNKRVPLFRDYENFCTNCLVECNNICQHCGDKMITESNEQNDKCDFCNEPAIFKVKKNDNDWSISCNKHKKDALESLENKS